MPVGHDSKFYHARLWAGSQDKLSIMFSVFRGPGSTIGERRYLPSSLTKGFCTSAIFHLNLLSIFLRTDAVPSSTTLCIPYPTYQTPPDTDNTQIRPAVTLSNDIPVWRSVWYCSEQFFHIRTAQHRDVITVSFIHQIMHQWVVLTNNIEIWIKYALKQLRNVSMLQLHHHQRAH